MRNKKNLNTRQWKLYEFLKENMDGALTLDEIMDKSKLYEDLDKRTLTADLQKLKTDPTIKRIIITSRTGIKIASTKEEADLYLEKEKAEILRRLKRYFLQANNIELDKQTQIVWNSEKDTIEVFK